MIRCPNCDGDRAPEEMGRCSNCYDIYCYGCFDEHLNDYFTLETLDEYDIKNLMKNEDDG